MILRRRDKRSPVLKVYEVTSAWRFLPAVVFRIVIVNYLYTG
jgi:hypothetical protein